MRRHERRGYMLFRVVRWVLRQLGFAYFHLRIEGLKFLPVSGPAILAGNHPSIVDGILLLIVSPRPVRFLVAEEWFFHPLLHSFFTAIGCIPVYRTKAHNGEALRAAVAALRRGDVLGVFPEGTTSDRGALRTVRRGVGLLALKTGAPVIPFGVWGSAEAYPAGARLPRPGQITLVFAPPIAYRRIIGDPIPAEPLQVVLEDIRLEVWRAMDQALRVHVALLRPWWFKRFQVALSAVVVLPLSGLLSLTANPSLEPVAEGTLA